MVTVITASGSPIILPLAHDVSMRNGRLVCVDTAGERVLSFDPLDVTAYAVEKETEDTVWVMGGLNLLQAEHQGSESSRPLWRLPARLRFTYR